MSTYYDVLCAVTARIEGLPELAGARVALRPAIAFLKDAGDCLPLVVVAPRKDSWEPVVELFFDAAAGGVRLGLPVVVAAIVENRFDLQQLAWQLGVREGVRRRLWDARAIGSAVPTVTDCEYDPVPFGVDLSALAPPLEASLQQFTYTSDEARYVP